MGQLEQIVDKYSDELGNKKNVVAIAVGKKWVNGTPTDEDAIIVLVEKKMPISSLSITDRIPNSLDGIITDVVGKVGNFSAKGFTRKERPAPAGISTGHLWITAGTIGGYFLDRDKHLVMLSNNHVLAAENRGRKGHNIIQPGRYDGGRPTDAIGKLKQFERIITTRQKMFNRHARKLVAYNLEDSATATINNKKAINNIIKAIGVINGFNDNVTVGMRVQKSGRTTSKTTGRVIGTHATVYVAYNMGTAQFRNQILTTRMSSGGDSGSLLLDMNRKAVGLLFAGSSSITVHNLIRYPRATYGLNLVPGNFLFKPPRRRNLGRSRRRRPRRRRVRTRRGRPTRGRRRRPPTRSRKRRSMGRGRRRMSSRDRRRLNRSRRRSRRR